MSTLLITLYLVVLYLVEALHDSYVIKAGETDHSFNRKWHKADVLFHSLTWGLISLLQHDPIFLIVGACVRIVVFQNMLNVFRKKPFFYLGTAGMDGWIKSKFGKFGPYLIFTIGTLVLCVINWFWK